LFFVSLGTKIPRPDVQLVLTALALSAFLIVSRFISITPILHFFKLGNRISFVPAVNLAQMSEFSLVICALGVSAGHIREDLLSTVVFTFVIMSVLSTYAIQYNHSIFLFAKPVLRAIGLKDLDHEEEGEQRVAKPIVFLGFSRYASSLFHELLAEDPALAHEIAVIDFNPQVKQELDRRGIHNIYGDVSHFDTLQHAHLEEAEVLISTIPDAILKGTTNERLLRQLKSIAPNARVITTGEFYYSARDLYREGSAFVFIPRLMSVERLAHAVRTAMNEDPVAMRAEELQEIQEREGAEILP
jgi:voltage-gated potassium channel Kch